MAISFIYAKRTAKLGTKLLIPLLVIDTAWSVLRFIVIHTTFNSSIPETFVIIESIITNLLFTVFLCILTAGVLMLAIYYSKLSKFGIYATVLLLSFIGIKVAFIFFRFTQLIRDYSSDYMTQAFHVFELITACLLILSFILFDIFQIQLKKHANIGYGHSPFPYIFAIFAVIYPIANILSLAGVDYISINAAFTIMRTLAFVASILEIILYFDLLRRFDFMQSLDEVTAKPTEEEK